MKTIFRYILTWFILLATFAYQKVFAIEPDEDAISDTENIIGISNSRLKRGDVSFEDIPIVIATLIQVGIGIAGTVSIVMLIYFAVQMQLKSGITGDTTGVDKAKKGMFGSVIGFVLAISAWFIMARVIDLLGAVSS
ncbi:hypothetical protein CSB09_04245 [Candidatus Gracilibacteria bacterium]|nr:MAG: hypothetical protein CSB09_04245 [Candidatus Gracilibacteria bacterium]